MDTLTCFETFSPHFLLYWQEGGIVGMYKKMDRLKNSILSIQSFEIFKNVIYVKEKQL